MERGGTLCNNNRDFIKQAIKEDVRIDGRQPYDHRKLSFEFSLDDSSATVQLGGTRVLAAVAAALEAPFNERGCEGALRFNVELSPMASPAFESGRQGEAAVELARIVERAIKQSGAVDMEALCVLPGRKVWSLRVDVHVLDHCGNLVDAATLAALAALAAYRKPQVSVGQDDEGGPGQITVHSPDVREPQPLTLHHLPFPVTFALFERGNLVAVDPSLQEEAAMEGSLTLVLNPHGEICAVQKADGVGLDRDQLMRCVRLAAARAGELAGALKEALRGHDAARVAARVRRRAGGAAAGAGAAVGGGGGGGGVGGRNVVVLRDVGQADARLEAMMKEMEATAAALAREAEASSGDGSSGSSSSYSSSGDDSSDEEDRQQQPKQRRGDKSADASAAAKQQQQQQQQPAAGFIKPKKATLKSEDFARKATIASAAATAATKRPLQQPAPKGGRPSRPRFGDPDAAPADNMAAIAAIIAAAGAGGGGGGAPPDLAAAIKPKAKNKKKAAGAGRGG